MGIGGANCLPVGLSVTFLVVLSLSLSYQQKSNKRTLFLIVLFIVGAFVGLCLYYNFPALLFWSKVFTPLQYASNPMLASISHLTIATGYIFSSIYLFHFRVKTEIYKSITSRVILQMVLVLYFIFIYDLLCAYQSLQYPVKHIAHQRFFVYLTLDPFSHSALGHWTCFTLFQST